MAHSHFVGFVMRRLIYRCSGTTSTTHVLGLQRCNCIYKHFVEKKKKKKKQCVEIFRTFTDFFVFFFFFFFFFVIKTTVQEFEQNQYHDRSSEMNMLFSK